MERLLARALISMAAAVAAIILVATAVVFLGAALYLCLVDHLSAAPSLAALLVGVVGLLLAGLISVASWVFLRCGCRRRISGNTASADAELAGNVNDLAAKLGGLAARELTSQAQAHPYRTVIGALLAGLAVGACSELRGMLDKMLKN